VVTVTWHESLLAITEEEATPFTSTVLGAIVLGTMVLLGKTKLIFPFPASSAPLLASVTGMV
jgi:hypothetical protein